MKAVASSILALVCACCASAAEVDVRLKRLPGAAYEVRGSFTVDASTPAVWDVLTDYEGIPSFVSSMRESRVRETREDGVVIVEQEAVGGVFFLKRAVKILLEVRREDQALRFEDVGRESFWRYEGGWSAEKTPGGVRVSYRLVAQPDFTAPSMIMSRVMRRGARGLLDQVRVEILRREGVKAR